jgi:DNA invertase Pin-like site-specific DNA recombinase
MAVQRRSTLYNRVSTDVQTTENQLLQLRDHAARMNLRIVAELEDERISGNKGKARRPGFDRLCNMIARGEVDIVLCYSVETLSYSLNDLVGFLLKLQSKNVELFLHQHPSLDTSNPSAYALLALFAELERSLVRDRIMLGLDRARKNGIPLGRLVVIDP